MRNLKELPEKKHKLKIERNLNNKEMSIVKAGKGPSTMDNRWIIYYNDSWLYFHRSWTGNCIYKAKIEEQEDDFKLTEVLVNGEFEEYKYTNDDQEILYFEELFNLYLEGKL